MVAFFEPYLTAQAQGAVEAAALRVLRHGQFVLGDEVRAFEDQAASFVGAPYAVGVSSGTDALLMALMALDVGPGDEVIVPDFTFFSPAGCVARLGASPVFVDIDEFYGLDPVALDVAWSPKTKAVIAVHLFGQLCDIDTVARWCDSMALPLIEDCAQAFGARLGTRHAGSWGQFACYSFFPTKNLGAAGDAGLITTHNERHAERLRRLRVHGAHPKYIHQEVGGNFRMDALQAAILGAKLPFLEEWTAARRRNAEVYRSNITIQPKLRPGIESTFHQYVIEVERRDAFREHLSRHGIETAVYYPLSMRDQPCFHLSPAPSRSRAVADRVVALPIHPGLTESDLRRVCDVVRSRPIAS